MPKGSDEGTTAGNRQINANSTVTIGLMVIILGACGSAIYKAGEVITDIGYVKRDIGVLTLSNATQAADVAEMKRIIQRIDRQQAGGAGK